MNFVDTVNTKDPLIAQLQQQIECQSLWIYNKKNLTAIRAGYIMRFIYWLFGWSKQAHLDGLECMNRYLKRIELSRINKHFISSNESPALLKDIENSIHVVKQAFDSYFLNEKKEVIAEKIALKTEKLRIKAQLTSLKGDKRLIALYRLGQIKAQADKIRSQKAIALSQTTHLHRKYFAIKYQRISQKEIMSHEPASFMEDQKWLQEKLYAWKTHSWLIAQADISPCEQQQINILCHYPDFVMLLRSDISLRHHCLHILFDNLKGSSPDAAHIYIQFPSIIERLEKALLDKKIGSVNTTTLQIQEKFLNEGISKDVTLLIEGRPESLLRMGRTIDMVGQTVKIRSLFQSFARKNIEVGEFEFFQNGIQHVYPFNSPIDFSRTDYYRQLPIWKTMTKDEVIQKYGSFLYEKYQIDLSEDLKNNIFTSLLIAKASRTTPDQSPIDTHAWAEVLIPLENESFHVFAPGKYPLKYPQGFIDRLFFSCSTVLGTITIKDENVDYNHRQHYEEPYPITQQQLIDFLELVRHDFVKAQNKQMYFQVQGKNCAEKIDKWFRKIFPQNSLAMEEEREHHPSICYHSLYRTGICQSKLPQPFRTGGHLIKSIPYLGSDLAYIARCAVSYFLGSHSGITLNRHNNPNLPILHRLADFPEWQQGLFYNPAFAFTQTNSLQ